MKIKHVKVGDTVIVAKKDFFSKLETKNWVEGEIVSSFSETIDDEEIINYKVFCNDGKVMIATLKKEPSLANTDSFRCKDPYYSVFTKEELKELLNIRKRQYQGNLRDIKNSLKKIKCKSCEEEFEVTNLNLCDDVYVVEHKYFDFKVLSGMWTNAKISRIDIIWKDDSKRIKEGIKISAIDKDNNTYASNFYVNERNHKSDDEEYYIFSGANLRFILNSKKDEINKCIKNINNLLRNRNKKEV